MQLLFFRLSEKNLTSSIVIQFPVTPHHQSCSSCLFASFLLITRTTCGGGGGDEAAVPYHEVAPIPSLTARAPRRDAFRSALIIDPPIDPRR